MEKDQQLLVSLPKGNVVRNETVHKTTSARAVPVAVPGQCRASGGARAVPVAVPGQCQWRCQGSASGGARAVPVAVPGQCQWRCQGSASGGARAVPVAVPGQCQCQWRCQAQGSHFELCFGSLRPRRPSSVDSPTFCRRVTITSFIC